MRILILILLLLFPSLASGDPAPDIPPVYQSLSERLSRDGFGSEFLSKLFTDERAGVIPDRMVISLDSKEKEEFYTHFLSSESILLSKRFLRENHKFLEEVERRFNVEKEVIVAILLVESKFGENTGKHRVVPTLASMAVMDTPDNLQSNFLILRDADPELSYEWVEKKAKRRANWAYHELKCFLNIIRDEQLDPLEVKGSYAGALGMPQFIPSSYIAFAYGQEGFENWLLSKESATLSVANYLNLHGWKKKISMEKKRKVLWYYNHSGPYIDTILKVAQKIRQK
ncbi:MAG TPA: lytic murein transglycosylase [Thermodesulfobacteriota bacterium]|nr:lytic murein transglycosylase [Thermodesulfobacteriota bacterium]